MLASRAARNPETAATMPWRSGQAMSRRASIGAGGYLAGVRVWLAALRCAYCRIEGRE